MPTRCTRRSFLLTTAFALGGVGRRSAGEAGGGPDGDRVMTVTGEIPAGAMGRTLTHEHVTTDFLGAERLPAPRYDRREAQAVIEPFLRRLAARGVGTLVECTPAYIGRDVRLLRSLSEAAGLRIITNTGYYGAVANKYLPGHAHRESVEALADRWLGEWRDGIEGTGIRPGFIKLGTGSGRLPELHVRLLRAACRVHRETGLTLAVHTGDGVAAQDEVRVLGEEGVAPSALIWVHAQNDPGPVQRDLARQGVWISLDGYSLAAGNPERYLDFLRAHREAGTLGRVLLSHDDGWAVEGEAASGSPLKPFANGNPEPYQSLFARGLPDLRQAGFSDADLERLLVRNPSEAFTVRKRLRDA